MLRVWDNKNITAGKGVDWPFFGLWQRKRKQQQEKTPKNWSRENEHDRERSKQQKSQRTKEQQTVRASKKGRDAVTHLGSRERE